MLQQTERLHAFHSSPTTASLTAGLEGEAVSEAAVLSLQRNTK